MMLLTKQKSKLPCKDVTCLDMQMTDPIQKSPEIHIVLIRISISMDTGPTEHTQADRGPMAQQQTGSNCLE